MSLKERKPGNFTASPSGAVLVLTKCKRQTAHRQSSSVHSSRPVHTRLRGPEWNCPNLLCKHCSGVCMSVCIRPPEANQTSTSPSRSPHEERAHLPLLPPAPSSLSLLSASFHTPVNLAPVNQGRLHFSIPQLPSGKVWGRPAGFCLLAL